MNPPLYNDIKNLFQFDINQPCSMCNHPKIFGEKFLYEDYEINIIRTLELPLKGNLHVCCKCVKKYIKYKKIKSLLNRDILGKQFK